MLLQEKNMTPHEEKERPLDITLRRVGNTITAIQKRDLVPYINIRSYGAHYTVGMRYRLREGLCEIDGQRLAQETGTPLEEMDLCDGRKLSLPPKKIGILRLLIGGLFRRSFKNAFF